MARSPFTFSGALTLLDPDRGVSALFDKILGGAIFLGAAGAGVAAGPAAAVGLSATTLLGLVDPKNEAIRLLGPLVNDGVTRLQSTHGRSRHDLIAATHTITVLSSYFDGLREVLGRRYTELELTEKDKRRLTGADDSAGRSQNHIDDLLDFEIPLPSAEYGLTENLDQRLIPYYEQLAKRCLDFFTGLEAWSGAGAIDESALVERIVACAAAIYRDRMLELGPLPPFALWLNLNEHAATRALLRSEAETSTEQAAALGELRTMLSIAMAGIAAPQHSYREQLALAAREVLDEPLLRSGLRTLASPKVKDGFVEPAFKLAIAEKDSPAADELWWQNQPTHESMVGYLAGYLASESSTSLPLLLLGHPGAGKSLLTEVLAAQLPTESFAVVRIPLRRVNTDDELAVQITKELQRVLQKPRADLDELRAECGTCRACVEAGTAQTCSHQCRLVVLLDGFDELVQATGVTQSGYLNKIVAFQKRAQTLGAPTSVVVTSRTVVADRAEIPVGTPMIKIVEFDNARIARWIDAWNTAHDQTPDFQPLDPAELTGEQSIAELARQPLLLLVLAVYLAELGTNRLGATELTQATLYQRILDRFITRQVTEKAEPDLAPAQQRELEAQQRKQLQFAAIGMFNRGRQHITDQELDADLAALAPRVNQVTEGQALSHAHRVLSEFMFVHNAKADREQRGAYEFLHATFGEYLVAELTVQLLLRLTRHRELEAAEPSLRTGPLNDDLLWRLLAHQPLSTRRPVLIFLAELVEDSNEDVQALYDTLAELLQAALIRPDRGDDPYQPLPYDPVRRRACYTANLTMLRVLLDDRPVPIDNLLGAWQPDNWERLVRLWGAGIDAPGWLTVMETLGATTEAEGDPSTQILLTPRINDDRGPAVYEAELIGDRKLMATLIAGDLAATGTEEWTDQELLIINEIARIHFVSTGLPHLHEVLPFDYTWYQRVLDFSAAAQQLNDRVKGAILILLSQNAEFLPYHFTKDLIQYALPAPNHDYPVEIAGIVAARPALLGDLPQLQADILGVEPENASAVVALLWYGERNCPEPDRAVQLCRLRAEVDLELVSALPVRFNSTYFSPQFAKYLRVEQPQHWLHTGGVLELFRDLPPEILSSISPADAQFAAETWLDDTAAWFIPAYLKSCDVTPEHGEGTLDDLRTYAASRSPKNPPTHS